MRAELHVLVGTRTLCVDDKIEFNETGVNHEEVAMHCVWFHL